MCPVEFCMESVVKAEVEAEKDITAVCVEGSIYKKHPIDHLNALEETDNPWPHDEAYCFSPTHGCYLRFHRLRGRKDFTTAEERDRQLREQTEELKALKATSASQKETIARQGAQISGLTTLAEEQRGKVASQGSEIESCKAALSEQGGVLSAVLDRLKSVEASQKKKGE